MTPRRRCLTALWIFAACGCGAVRPPSADWKPNAGTEIYVRRSVLGTTYHHAGVYIGDGRVVHVNAEPRNAATDLLLGKPVVKVLETDLQSFAGDAEVRQGPSVAAFPPKQIVERARAMVGRAWPYDPYNHNCQHFSSERVSGIAQSPEAEQIRIAMQATGRDAKRGLEAGKNGFERGAKKVGTFINDALSPKQTGSGTSGSPRHETH